MQYPLSSFFLRGCVARRSKAAHISRSSPHQVLGNSHEKRLDVDEVLYQHYVKKLLVGYLSICLKHRSGTGGSFAVASKCLVGAKSEGHSDIRASLCHVCRYPACAPVRPHRLRTYPSLAHATSPCRVPQGSAGTER